MTKVSFLQINLQHSKEASDVLNKVFNTSMTNWVLIQEPYVYGGIVRRLATTSGRLLYGKGTNPPRATMLIKPQQKYLLLTQFTCRDIVAVQASLPTDGGSNCLGLLSW